MKKEFIMKVEANGITIPKEKLKGIREGDLVSIKINKIYVDEENKESLCCLCMGKKFEGF